MHDNNLIIIASQPRSGSTLLQALLSNNDQVGTISEPWLLLPFLSYNRKDLVNSAYAQQLAIKGIDGFLNETGVESFHNDISTFLLKQYGKVLKDNEKFVLDKTPRYYEILDEIIQYFPNCKIIVLKRHPFSVLKSIIKTWKVRDIDKLLDFKRDILNAPQLLHDFAKRNENNANVKCIRYEDLVKNPNDLVKTLYSWIGIEYKAEMLNYSDNKKYLGRLGDPVGVKKNSTPNLDSLRDWNDLLKEKYWGKFLSGYFNFLTPEFLNDYGDYGNIAEVENKSTLIFKVFLQKSKWKFKEHEAPKLKLIKYSILRNLGFFKK